MRHLQRPNFKVFFSNQSDNHALLAGNAYLVEARSEAAARRAAREWLKATFPWGGWKIRYAIEVTKPLYTLGDPTP